MTFIDLFDAGRPVGTYTLPDNVRGTDGHEFALRHSVKGGSNGIVFRARPIGKLAQEVDECAVKFLRQCDANRRDRFANEARILRMLDCPHISPLFDDGRVEVGGHEVPWIAMELGGSNLRLHVEERGPLDASTLCRAGLQICTALEHLHARDIIHRDVKPANFVWDGENPNDIMMIDFGIAKLVREDVSGRPMDQFTQQTEFVGPVFYSSPELIAYASNKAEPVDQRSDLFQLGRVLWFLATGRIGAGVPSIRHCPVGTKFHALVTSLLNDSPEDRPASAAEVRDWLQRCW